MILSCKKYTIATNWGEENGTARPSFFLSDRWDRKRDQSGGTPGCLPAFREQSDPASGRRTGNGTVSAGETAIIIPSVENEIQTPQESKKEEATKLGSSGSVFEAEAGSQSSVVQLPSTSSIFVEIIIPEVGGIIPQPQPE